MAIHWTEENASQESLNAWIHGIAFLLSLPGAIVLVYLARQFRPEMMGACAVYGMSLGALYLGSTLSHAVRAPALRHRCRTWDQGLIYFLIAGTVTPLAWGFMDSWGRIGLVLMVWMLAAAGFYSKVFGTHRIDNMTTVTYVLLGWIPSMILLAYVPLGCFAMMAIGGVLYTVGTLFLQNDHRHWSFHPIWHSMVVLASMFFYAAMVMYPILRLDEVR
jgi:hemolysin III